MGERQGRLPNYSVSFSVGVEYISLLAVKEVYSQAFRRVSLWVVAKYIRLLEGEYGLAFGETQKYGAPTKEA
jgi:hypothetical protein